MAAIRFAPIPLEAMSAVVTLDTNLHRTIEFVQVSTCIASRTECTNIKGYSNYCIYNMYFYLRVIGYVHTQRQHI